MTGLFKRPGSPFYYFRFEFGGRDFWLSTRTTSKAAAERVRAEKIAQILQGRVPDGKARLGTVAEDYLRWFEAQGSTPGWVRNRRVWVRHALDFFGESIPVRLVTAEEIEEYKKALFRTPSYLGGTFAPRTVRGYLTALRQLFDYAVRRGYLGRSPARDVKMPPPTRPNPRFLTLEELGRLVEAAPSPWWRAFLTVAAYTGMRRSELGRFRWGDIDRARGRIRIFQVKTKQTIEVPVHPELEAALRTVPRSTLSARVFFIPTVPSERYEELWEDRVTAKVAAIFKKAGLKGSLHALRHTYATLLLSASGNLMAVKEALGHRQIATTMQYAFLLREGLDDAVKRLPGLLPSAGLNEASGVE